MKKLLFCFLILVSFSSYASDLPGNPANDTKIENLQRYKNHLQNQLAYQRSMADVHASIVTDPQGRQSVKQMLARSGVLQDGSKAELKTVVTQPVDKAKVAKTLTERLKNAKDYAKNVGKASIPTFVGMAAFHGLMEGIGWVMDEGGEVKKTSPDSDNQNDVQPYHQYYYVLGNFWGGGGGQVDNYCRMTDNLYKPKYNNLTSAANAVVHCWEQYNQKTFGSYSIQPNGPSAYAVIGQGQLGVNKIANPNYNPDATVPQQSIDPQEIQIALQQALLNNNAMQAAMIAQAIKDAYSFDGSEGQKSNSNELVKAAADDMSEALPKAFDNPVPTSNPERPSGYYKITDGDKTVEGYVTPAPIGGTTDTTTTPTIDPVTGQPTGETTTSGGFELPPFCDWAGIVCDWIEWTKEPYEDEEEFETPIKEIEKKEIKKDLVNASAPSCPADIRFDVQGLPFGISIDKSYQMQPICNTVEPLKYVFQLITFCMCAFMLLRV